MSKALTFEEFRKKAMSKVGVDGREYWDAAFEWWANGGDSQDGESFAKFEERYLDTITEGGKS